MCVPARRQTSYLSGGTFRLLVVALGRVFLTWPFLSQAFFDKDYITKHPGDAEKITQLKELMQEQVCLARVGGQCLGGKG